MKEFRGEKMQPDDTEHEIPSSLTPQGTSYLISNEVADDYIRNPNNPFLVSFPRTGSHWLRMMMEKYFERPTLRRIFFFPKNKNYLCLHVHDLDLEAHRSNVIYLHRDPIDTIYSQLAYHKEAFNDVDRISFWSELYGRHLRKWLLEETSASYKTVLTYENLINDLLGEFSKITNHYNEVLDGGRLLNIAEEITKRRVLEKTTHDVNVIQTNDDYAKNRQRFKEEFGDLVLSKVRLNYPKKE
jgi:hypothetical protein